MASLTPEQERSAREWAAGPCAGMEASNPCGRCAPCLLAAALVTIDELRVSVQRATLDAALFVDDARRWRAIWPQLCKYGRPFCNRVEAEEHADRLADEQEKTDD